MEKISKTTWILLGVLAVIVVIIIAVAMQGSKPSDKTPVTPPQTGTEVEGEAGEAGVPTGTTDEDSPLFESVVVVPGANPINRDQRVITTSGEEVRTDVTGESPLAPQQTLAVEKEELPDEVIKLEASIENGFSPSNFTVNAGAPVTISITNLETARSMTLAFLDPSLVGVILGAGPSETRAITFNAPSTPGDYEFMDGIPGRSARGVMTVR